MGRWAGLLLVGAVACGGSGEAPPDAGVDAPSLDAAGGPPVACHEMETPTLTLPVHVDGNVVGGGADLEAPAGCAVIDAPFGVESAGVDRVVRVGGLAVGTEYGVILHAASDLAFYVVTGCSTEAGPTDGECDLFVDAADGDETGRFVATAPTAWVVVDTYSSTPPADGAFTLDLYPIECADDTGCAAPTPACADGRCVGCVDSFDCMTAARPRCDTVTHTCAEGDSSCSGDDTSEPSDDGPGGATTITVNGGGNAILTGSICDVPTEEDDYVRFVVTYPGESWRFTLAWQTGDDLDLYAYDATGRALGLSYYEQPETIALTYLAPGTYYVRIDDFAGGTGPAVPYSLTAHRTQGPGCTGPADCAADYRNQTYRGDCVAGSCVSIVGAGAVGAGGACDSPSDCATGLSCPSFYFVADADTRDRCMPGCDGGCAAGTVCTTYLTDNFCIPMCTADDQCPTIPDWSPLALPWYRLSCDVTSGSATFGQCLFPY